MGKDGEGVAMVERTASSRYPSVPPHQGESDISLLDFDGGVEAAVAAADITRQTCLFLTA